MGTLLVPKIGSRRSCLSGLLASTALIGVALAPTVAAAGGDYTLGGLGPFAINSALDPFIFTNLDSVVNITSDQNSQVTINTGLAATGVTNVSAGATITSAGYGIWTGGFGTDITVNMDGIINAGTNGLTLGVGGATSGDLIAQGAGSVTGTLGHGIWMLTGADLGAGTVTVDGFAAGVSGALSGVETLTAAGDTLINMEGIVEGGLYGIRSVSTLGGGIDITAATTVEGGGNGIAAQTAGTMDVTTNGAVTGTAGYGIWTIGTVGDTTITANDTVDAGTSGIVATSTTGAITITTAADVTAPAWGIYAVSGATGPVTVNVNGGTVSGNAALEARSFGDVIINVAAGATVSGTTTAIYTGSGTTTMTTNDGLVTTTADDGAATTTGGIAYWTILGSSTLDNNAEVRGLIATAGTDFTMNNVAGATWIAGNSAQNAFAAVADTVNNSGTILIRENLTSFTGLEDLNNLSGGTIDMTYGLLGNDDLWVLNFDPQGGSNLLFDVDLGEANQVSDTSSTGLGRADTISVFGTATPTGVTNVGLTLGGVPVSSLIGTSGSIALVDTTAANLLDPGLNGYATIVASDNYTFISDPSSGAVAMFLVEDAGGGVYLQWAPRITAATLGGFMGGNLDGSGSAGADIAAAGAGTNGIGAVASSIADAAASAGMGNDPSCNKAQPWNVWGMAEGTTSNYSGGTYGYGVSGTIGIERDVSAEESCGKRVIGAFAFTGNFGSDFASGSSNGWNGGIGTYGRATGDNGFYGSVLGAVSMSNTDGVNSIFGSTSSQDAVSYMATAALGIVRPLSEQTWVDVRGFAAYSATDGSAFTDSAGIAVDGSNSSVVTLGASLGLHHKFNEATKGFVRGGVKWSEASRSMSAFGIEASGKSSGTFGSIEAGFESKLNERTTLNGSIFGEFGDGSTTLGGKVKLAVKF